MSDQTTLFTRIGSWIKNATRIENDPIGRLNGEEIPPHMHQLHEGALEPRTTFLRPWVKRDAAMENVQGGITALADLMTSIRDNMEKQSQRQDDLLEHISQLSTALQSLPETSRLQAETLEAIQQQMEGQSAQQAKLAEILEHLGQSGQEQRRTLDTVQERVESLNSHDQKISDSLNEVGTSMKAVSANSQQNAQVLQQMRDNQMERDGELERILHRQGSRFTTLLSVAICLSIAALVAVGVLGYLAYESLEHLKH